MATANPVSGNPSLESWAAIARDLLDDDRINYVDDEGYPKSEYLRGLVEFFIDAAPFKILEDGDSDGMKLEVVNAIWPKPVPKPSAKALHVAFGAYVSNRDALVTSGYNLEDVLGWGDAAWRVRVQHWQPFEDDSPESVAEYIRQLAREIDEEFAS